MWMLKNQTPFAAERNWVLDKNAAKSWVVVVKATFDILPDGSTKIADKQEEPLYGEEYSGVPGESSVLYDVDLAGPKTRTDIVLNGHAYAPKGKPATSVTVTMKVHKLTKQLVVWGDRQWGRLGLSMTSPQPFEKMPIVYERAFGGWDKVPEKITNQRLEPRNPIGAGFAIRPEHLANKPLPNIEHPKHLISSWNDRPPPAGFGVIASYWHPRLKYGGTYDDKWIKERLPLLAEDFDERYFQSAPEDQQTPGFLRGGENVELFNLSPNGQLNFCLPKIHLGFQTRFGSDRIDHIANLHTVILEPDSPRVIIVWHTSLSCPNTRVDYLDETLIFEKDVVPIGARI
jgi:hypothetical protein